MKRPSPGRRRGPINDLQPHDVKGQLRDSAPLLVLAYALLPVP